MAVKPQTIAADRASGAAPSEGSFTFSTFGTDFAKGNYLTRTPSGAGNTQTWTWSAWVKRCGLYSNGNNIFAAYVDDNNRDTIRFGGLSADCYEYQNYDGGNGYGNRTNSVYRDVIGWYHVVIAYNSTLTEDRVKYYINGTQITWLTNQGSGGVTLNQNSHINTTGQHFIGARKDSSGVEGNFDGMMSQAHFIDGLALGPGYFGFTDPLTNSWRPRKFTAEGTTVNDGTVFSNGMTAAGSGGWKGGYGPDQSFDGDLTTRARSSAPSNNGLITFTAATPIQYKNSIRAYNGTGDSTMFSATWSFNGGAATSVSSTGWQTIATGSGKLTTLSTTRDGDGEYFSAIEVDGIMMVDSTTTNLDYGTNGFYLPFDGSDVIGKDQSGKGNDWKTWFGGTAVPAKATGAKPILEIVNGGKVGSAGVTSEAGISTTLQCAIPFCMYPYDESYKVRGGSKKPVTIAGNTHHSTDTSIFYGSSYEFDGTGDYIVIPNSGATTDFGLVEQDWTVEVWAYITGKNGTYGRLWYLEGSSSSNIDGVYFSDTNMSMGTTGVWSVGDGTGGDYKQNQWQHIAVCHDSTNIRMYINGIEALTSSSNFYDSASKVCTLMSTNNGSFAGLGIGYLQDFRIYNGHCKYTKNFTPASAHPSIVTDSPSNIVYGSNPKTPLNGSVEVQDGNYLTLPESADWYLGDTFTVEAWVYALTTGTDRTIVAQGASGWKMYVQSNGRPTFYDTTGGEEVSGDSGHVEDGKWSHIAFSCNSGTGVFYINGEESGSSGSMDVADYTSPLQIGREGSDNLPWKGYISNLRIVKGTALYTTNFNPIDLAQPLTNVTNTKLLCCQDPKKPLYNTSAAVAPDAGTGTALLNIPLSSTPFADSSSTGATITNTGSIAAASAGTNNFDITNAASLDGSSQRLSTNNTNLTFTGSWTFDAWFKLDSSASGYNALFNSGYGASSSPYMYLSINDDEKPYVEGGSAGGATTATNAINKNQWYHMRVTSDGTKIRQYIDGELVVTHGANSTDLSSAGTKTIGSLLDNGNNANNFHGLIGPVRYVSSNLGVPPVGGLKTSSGALSNTPDVPDIISPGGVDSSFFNPYMTEDIDTVMGQESSYPTLNPVSRSQALTSGQNPGTAPARLTNNNLTVDTNGLTNDYNMNVTSTFGMTSGKFYCEYLHTYSSTGGGLIGISPGAFLNGHYAGSSGYQPGGSDPNTENAYGMYMWNRGILHENTYNINGTASNYHSRVAQYSIVGIALDMDNYKCWWSVDGVWQQYPNCGLPYPDPETGKDAPAWGFDDTSDTWYFCWTTTGGESGTFNFGQQPFKYTPPKGFGPPNLANTRPSTVITRPDKYVAVTTYAGDGTSVIVRDFQFKPDFVWLKGYTDPDKHGLYDTVRGATERLISSATTEEQNHNGVVSFDDKGFNVGNYAETNGSGRGYVAWAWKAGGNKGTWNKNGEDVGSLINAGLNYGDTAKLNGASVGTRQGFSIVKWTQDGGGAGSQIAHGLTQAPNLVIMKHLNATSNWFVTHTSLSAATKVLYLNDDTEEDTSSDFGNTFPGATYTTTSTTGVDGREVIMYSWHDVPGLQKFGKYKGNGNADGPYVDLGFRPALLWVKDITDDWSWYVIDNKRSPYNVTSKTLKLNTDDDQDTSTQYNCFDFLSTGFKVRAAPSNSEPTNDTADTYVYCAWAESPASNLYGGHSDAR